MTLHSNFRAKVRENKEQNSRNSLALLLHSTVFVQSAFLWAYFQGRLFSEGLVIGGYFTFQNGLDLAIKTA